MTRPDRPAAPRRLAGPLAVLAAALIGIGVVAGCTDTAAPSTPHGGSSGTHHGEGSGGGHRPTPPSGHFDPAKCPAGLVC